MGLPPMPPESVADLTPQTVNPFGKTHGSPTDDARHVGDLGNIETDAQGNAKGSVTDKLVKLIGPESVIGVSKEQDPDKDMQSTNGVV